MTGDRTKATTEGAASAMLDAVAGWPAEKMASLMVESTPYSVALGFRYVSSSPGFGSIMLPWRADLVGLDGTDILASGAVTALIDHTCGLAIMAYFGTRAAPATLDLRVDHMRPAAAGASVIASAHCYKVTRSIAFLRAEAWDVSRDDPVATAQAAFTLNRRETR